MSTQGANLSLLCLLHSQVDSFPPSHQGSPILADELCIIFFALILLMISKSLKYRGRRPASSSLGQACCWKSYKPILKLSPLNPGPSSLTFTQKAVTSFIYWNYRAQKPSHLQRSQSTDPTLYEQKLSCHSS